MVERATALCLVDLFLFGSAVFLAYPVSLDEWLFLGLLQGRIKKERFSTSQEKLLYCPAVFGHFLDPLGNHPRGAIFPTMDPSY